jgi:hypothetical protein
MTTKSGNKVECLNPNTGGKMNIDAAIYELFSKAIYGLLKAHPGITYTDIVNGIRTCFKQQKTIFKGSVEWYAVTVKKDMEANGVIEVYMEKGKKLHRLKKVLSR